ncbi:MAG: S26 family signal peptidase [Candidatus Altiarchaeota archaeon]
MSNLVTLLEDNMSSLKPDNEEEKFSFKKWIWGWIRDFVEVGVTVGIVLIVLKLTLGSHSIVPLVVVTSGSMVHEQGDSAWKDWMTARGLTDIVIGEFPMLSGFQRGDMIVTYYPEGAGLGDIIIYDRDLMHMRDIGRNDPIIHRVIGYVDVEDGKIIGVNGTLDCAGLPDAQKYIKHIEQCQAGYEECVYPAVPEGSSFRLFFTKGDHNTGSDQCSKNGGIAFPVNEAQLSARALVRLPYVGYLKIILNEFLNLLFFWI